MAANNVNRFSMAIGVAGLLAFVAGGWLYLESRKHPSAAGVASHAEAEKKEAHAEEAKEGHSADEHGGEVSDLDRPVEELWASRCEHDLAQYECDECRYEVGIVKIPADMIATGGNGGIVRTGKPAPMTFSGEFAVTGEVGMNEEKTTHAVTPLSGTIKKLYVSVGERVAEGSPLFDLDSHEVSEAKATYLKALSGLDLALSNAKADYQKALSALDNEIAEGKASYQKALAALDLAQKTADREKRLFEKSIAAKSEVEESAARFQEARVEAGNARMKLARLGVSDLALDDLGKSVGVSPDNPTVGQAAGFNPAEAVVNAASAKAGLRRLGVEESEIAKIGGSKYDLSGVDALPAKGKAKQPEAVVEVANAKARLLKLGVGEGAIAQLEEGVSDLSGVITVRSTGSGVVLERHGALGEFVEAGKDLLQLSDFSELWVWANVGENELASLRKTGGPFMADVEVPGGRRLRGQIDLASGVYDKETRNFRARVALQNPGSDLRPGMFATIHMLLPGRSDALAVPKAAVLIDEGRPFVFVHKEKEFWIRRPIVAGKEAGGMVEVAEGLTGGQTILTDGSFVAKSDVLRSKMGAGCAD